MSTQSMSFNLRVWRQDGPQAPGRLVDYKVVDISPEMSFLEMLDELNVQLTRRGERPVEFDSDCREGICGMCGLVITGVPHGPLSATTTCTLRMRHFQNGQTIVIEPFRAAAFPIVRDLVVDRSALDRIIQAGGFVSQNVGSAPDGNAIPVPKDDAENAMDAAVLSAVAPAWRPAPTLRPSFSPPPRFRSWPVCPRVDPRLAGGWRAWSARWTSRASGTAPTTGSARPSAPRRSPSSTSPGCGRNTGRRFWGGPPVPGLPLNSGV